MTLVAEVQRALGAAGVKYALIGAVAMAARGAPRSTMDIDFLTVDPEVLDAAFWGALRVAGACVDVRPGDDDDPLLGVVRITRDAESPVDLIVGRSPWQHAIVACAESFAVLGISTPIATLADLVLLKLYAGGPQDRWDIAELLALADASSVDAVERELGRLPARCRELWRTLRVAG